MVSGEPLILVRKLSPRYSTPIWASTRIFAAGGAFKQVRGVSADASDAGIDARRQPQGLERLDVSVGALGIPVI